MQRGSGILKILLLLALVAPGQRTFAQVGNAGTLDSGAATTPLHLAAQSGNLSGARRLIEAGEQVDARDSRSMTPLHYAAIRGHVEVATLLLDRGADPNARAEGAMTPLHFAGMLGSPEMIGLLTRRGSRTDLRNEAGLAPLHLAADDRAVHALANSGAAVNARSGTGFTPLHTARQSSVARALLDHGADMRLRTPQGRTAMELAAVESLESGGLSVHSIMLGRLRGLVGEMPLTLTNISAQSIENLTIEARSPACDIEVEPATIPRIQAGQNADVHLSLTRAPSVREGEHPIFITISSAGGKLGQIDLRIDTHTGPTLEDRGMIRLAKGQMRPANSPWFYLVYASVPLLVLAAWLIFRRR